jgi:glycosyltransferase involved in cell wall biosynthesis
VTTVIWIDWYSYHISRFRALCEHEQLKRKVTGIELVGGCGVHAGLKFRDGDRAGLPITSLFPEADWKSVGQMRLSSAVWRKLNELDPSSVLVPGWYTIPGIAAALWAKLHGRRTILMSETTYGDHKRVWWKEVPKRVLVRSLFDCGIAGGKPQEQYLSQLGFAPSQIACFYDVVDNNFYRDAVDQIRQLPEVRRARGLPEKYFLYVGRLAREKNIEVLINAFAAYLRLGGTWSLVLVGDGPERERLEKQCKVLGIADRIEFAGLKTTKETLPYYAFAGCFVLASMREPWGLVVNEAMASGLPVIVSERCGCAEDLIEPAGNGYLFDPANEGELTGRLMTVSSLTQSERQAMSRRSREIIAGYSPQDWAAEVARIVERTNSPRSNSSSAKILMVNQFFWPDVAPTGQFLTDVARRLGYEGHDVTVICSGGLYGHAESAEDRPPVEIKQVPGLPYERSTLARLLSYGTFFIAAMWHGLRVPRQDVVVTMTTPPLLAIVGSLLKALRGTRHYVWEMDLFPDVFVSLGTFKENSWITRFLGWVEGSCRRRSDGIIAIGPCMQERLLARGLPKNLVRLAENWADGSVIMPGPYRSSGPLNILYSGNLGLAHEISTILTVMRHFRNDSRFVFTFAGGGVRRTWLEQICDAEGIRNALFLPYASRESMGEHLGKADIGLVTELPAFIGTVVPSKVYGLMAAGRPILFIGPRQATPDLLIRRFDCGWQIEPGHVNALVELLEKLSVNREEVLSRGRRARSAFERQYDLPQGVARVVAALGLATSTGPSASEARVAATNPV